MTDVDALERQPNVTISRTGTFLDAEPAEDYR